MADNVDITAGTGTTIATDDCTTGQVQLVKLAYGADGNRTHVPADVDGLLVNLGANNDVALAAGTNNIGDVDVLSIAAGDNNIGNVDIVTMPNVTIGTMAALVAGTANIGDVDVLTVNGVAPEFGSGVRGATVQRVTIATDDVVSASQSGTWNVTNVSGTISLPTGASTEATLSTLNGKVTACNTGAVVISSGTVTTVSTVTTCSTVTNLSQLGGQAIAMGTGVRSAGTLRVTVATDDVVPSAQSGTWTVQPGNTANTTPWLIAEATRTTGGPTTYHLVSAATTNATNIKASAGQLYGWYIYNSNAAARKVAFHNSASTPTAGASVYFSLVIPATSGANVFLPHGIPFSAGIGITTVTGLADADSAAVALNDLIINLWYS